MQWSWSGVGGLTIFSSVLQYGGLLNVRKVVYKMWNKNPTQNEWLNKDNWNKITSGNYINCFIKKPYICISEFPLIQFHSSSLCFVTVPQREQVCTTCSTSSLEEAVVCNGVTIWTSLFQTEPNKLLVFPVCKWNNLDFSAQQHEV